MAVKQVVRSIILCVIIYLDAILRRKGVMVPNQLKVVGNTMPSIP